MSVTFNCFIKKGDVMYAKKQAAPIRLEQIKNHAVSGLDSPPKKPCHRVHVFLIFALSVLP